MSQTLDAIFKDGSFTPLDERSVKLSEGQRVRLIVDVPANGDKDLIKLATHVFDDLAPEDIDEIERIALDRSNFFSDRTSS